MYETNNWGRMHHSSESYDVANSKAAEWAKDKFEKQIARGRETASQTIAKIVEQVPNDAIVAGRALAFQPSTAGLEVAFGDQEVKTIHEHAFRQMCGKASIPTKFGEMLRSGADWEKELLAHNMNEILHRANKRHFMRSVDNEIRGCLSDHYAPYDSSSIVNAVLGEFQGLGVVPLAGTFTDTRWSLKGVLPLVFEPFADEIMTYGLDIQNSDFGNGAFHVRLFANRVACTNLMTTEDGLRKVHLGGKLSDDFTFSRETYELNSKALISATRDTVKGLLGPGKINEMNELITTAHDKSLSWTEAKKRLGDLSKKEMALVEESFQGADVLNLPEGQSSWRLSNAVSWLAVNTESPERTLDLERTAGKILNR